MLYDSFSMSAKYTSAPRCLAHAAVETNVYGVVMTAVPGPTPHASIARIIPLVLLFTARLCTGSAESPSSFRPSSISGLEFIISENFFSNSSAYFPVVSQPEFRTSRTAFFSSSEIEGREKGTFSESASDIFSPIKILS